MTPPHATGRTARQALPPGRVGVLLPLPLGGVYDYRAPPGLDLAAGDFVVVPLGPRRVIGVVWGAGKGAVGDDKLKPVIGRIDAPPMTEELRALIDWTAAYTLSAAGAVLRMAMSVPAALEPAKTRLAYRLADGVAPDGGLGPVKPTAARRRVLAVLAGGPPLGVADLAREAAVGAGVVRGLAEAGVLLPVALAPRGFGLPDAARRGPVLSEPQARAVAELCGDYRDGMAADGMGAVGARVFVLDGVTGSGKTEVYFEAIASTLRAGRQALVLLPEIALTAECLDRFEARFGALPVAWHSGLTPARRRAAWRAVADGSGRVVVGARSALFLPFPELGLIVVDEEHDTSFKQDEGVIYNARDMAVVRGHLGGFPVVLVSATPSLETDANARQGRYRRIVLPARHHGASPPKVSLVDMRDQRLASGNWLSGELCAGLAATLEAGEQAMLYLNRRGYAPLVLCRACGHRFECPNCSAWLVEHRLQARLICHHCGYLTAPPAACPECGVERALVACGPGVERLDDEVARRFPGARTALMASDTLRGPDSVAELLRGMRERRIDVLIGTQVMAKGHHFPLLTLVGVVDADLGLAGGDLRAAERTFQVLHQVAGRAGRESRPGKVLMQTYLPDHPVMQALCAGDRDRFYAAEADSRRAHGMPPYGRLAAIIVSGPDEGLVDRTAAALGRSAPQDAAVRVFGPAPAAMALLRGRHRRRLLLKATREVKVQDVLRRWLGQVRPPAGVRIQVDVDPYSFV